MHASTVLYSVQRMAQLSALFSLLAVLAYIRGRNSYEQHGARGAWAWWFVAVPTCMGIGMFAKQNAATIPLLCLVVEIAYFRSTAQSRSLVLWFHGVFVAVPVAIVAAVLVVAPAKLLAGYGDLAFTAAQRVLTQPRVLLDYAATWLVPRTPGMGLYTDDYLVSRSLTDPPSTLLAVLGIVALSATVIALRRRSPTLLAGWFIFLAAHAVESSFLPLELYYEHRNYLPSLGLLLGLCGLRRLAPKSHSAAVGWRLALPLAAAAILGVLAFATLGRALVWQKSESIVEQGLLQHPGSLRAHLDNTSAALARGDYDRAAAALAPMAVSNDASERFVAGVSLALVDCLRGREVSVAELERFASGAPPVLTARELFVAELIQDISVAKLCPYLEDRQLGDALAVMLDSTAGQPESSTTKALFRSIAAQVYARAGAWSQARYHASIGWQATGRLPIGAVLAFSYAKEGSPVEARLVLQALKPKVPAHDTAWQRRLMEIEDTITRVEDETLSGLPRGRIAETSIAVKSSTEHGTH